MTAGVLARYTKSQRKADRARLGLLQQNIVLPATLKRYCVMFDGFSDFCRQRHPIPTLHFSKSEKVDLNLVVYFEGLWLEGEGKSIAEYTLAAILHFVPSLRGQLFCSARTLAAWRRLELPARAPLSL